MMETYRQKNEEDEMHLYRAKQLADGMRTVGKNTILIAEDIPEKDYGYRPSPESRSVKETLVHIASLWRFDRLVPGEQHLASLEGFDFCALFKRAETEEKLLRSKTDHVSLLKTQGGRWCLSVGGL